MRRIDLQPQKVKLIVLACCALHNLTRKTRLAPQGAPPTTIPLPQDQKQNNGKQMPGLDPVALRPGEQAKAAREKFTDYVNTVGTVPWQQNMVELVDNTDQYTYGSSKS